MTHPNSQLYISQSSEIGYARERRKGKAERAVLYSCGVAILLIGFFGAKESGDSSKYLTSFFEMLLGILFVIGTTRLSIDRVALRLAVMCFFYIIYSFCVFLLQVKEENYYFFIQSLKVFYYIIIIAPFVGKNIFSGRDIGKIVNVLAFLLATKYIISKFIFGIDRPILVVENNYELQSILLLYGISTYLGTAGVFARLLIYSAVILSGSRSALAALVFVEFILNIGKMRLTGIIGLLITPVLAFAGYLVFVQRLNGKTLEDIDRVRFFYLFLDEIGKWPIINYIKGNDIFKPLNSKTCGSLQYYSSFFDQQTGACYSSIFHSYNLRVFFDHGLLGFLLVYYFIFILLKRANVPRRCVLIVIGVAFINGMSVSSVNSVFFALPFLVIIACNFKPTPVLPVRHPG